MKIRNIATSVLILSLLAACSTGKLVNYKSGVSQVSPLEIPPDLTASPGNDQYSIPGENGEASASFSNFSKDATPQASSGNCSAVLPELKDRHMESNGMQHWIVVQDKAENVWPHIKSFWQEMGFKIAVDNPQAGVMETDWLENHGNVPRSYVRHILGNGKAVDILLSEGMRDQYMTRIERSKDGLSTEIHISSQQMQEMYKRNQQSSFWVARQPSPEIEIAVLQLMLDRLGAQPEKTEGSKPKVVSATAEDVPPQIQLKEDANGKVVQIDEPFDRSWRRVGSALDTAHITTTDKDRSIGVYFVSALEKPKSGKEQQSSYQVTLRENHEVTEVSVVDQYGRTDAKSAALLAALFQALTNNSAKPGPQP